MNLKKRSDRTEMISFRLISCEINEMNWAGTIVNFRSVHMGWDEISPLRDVITALQLLTHREKHQNVCW